VAVDADADLADQEDLADVDLADLADLADQEDQEDLAEALEEEVVHTEHAAKVLKKYVLPWVQKLLAAP